MVRSISGYFVFLFLYREEFEELTSFINCKKNVFTAITYLRCLLIYNLLPRNEGLSSVHFKNFYCKSVFVASKYVLKYTYIKTSLGVLE